MKYRLTGGLIITDVCLILKWRIFSLEPFGPQAFFIAFTFTHFGNFQTVWFHGFHVFSKCQNITNSSPLGPKSCNRTPSLRLKKIQLYLVLKGSKKNFAPSAPETPLPLLDTRGRGIKIRPWYLYNFSPKSYYLGT